MDNFNSKISAPGNTSVNIPANNPVASIVESSASAVNNAISGIAQSTNNQLLNIQIGRENQAIANAAAQFQARQEAQLKLQQQQQAAINTNNRLILQTSYDMDLNKLQEQYTQHSLQTGTLVPEDLNKDAIVLLQNYAGQIQDPEERSKFLENAYGKLPGLDSKRVEHNQKLTDDISMQAADSFMNNAAVKFQTGNATFDDAISEFQTMLAESPLSMDKKMEMNTRLQYKLSDIALLDLANTNPEALIDTLKTWDRPVDQATIGKALSVAESVHAQNIKKQEATSEAQIAALQNKAGASDPSKKASQDGANYDFHNFLAANGVQSNSDLNVIDKSMGPAKLAELTNKYFNENPTNTLAPTLKNMMENAVTFGASAADGSVDYGQKAANLEFGAQQYRVLKNKRSPLLGQVSAETAAYYEVYSQNLELAPTPAEAVKMTDRQFFAKDKIADEVVNKVFKDSSDGLEGKIESKMVDWTGYFVGVDKNVIGTLGIAVEADIKNRMRSGSNYKAAEAKALEEVVRNNAVLRFNDQDVLLKTKLGGYSINPEEVQKATESLIGELKSIDGLQVESGEFGRTANYIVQPINILHNVDVVTGYKDGEPITKSTKVMYVSILDKNTQQPIVRKDGSLAIRPIYVDGTAGLLASEENNIDLYNAKQDKINQGKSGAVVSKKIKDAIVNYQNILNKSKSGGAK